MAFIRDGRGRPITYRATVDEVLAVLRPGVKIAAAMRFEHDRVMQGRVLSVEGGRVQIDTTNETINARDVIAIKLAYNGAEDDREKATS